MRILIARVAEFTILCGYCYLIWKFCDLTGPDLVAIYNKHSGSASVSGFCLLSGMISIISATIYPTMRAFVLIEKFAHRYCA